MQMNKQIPFALAPLALVSFLQPIARLAAAIVYYCKQVLVEDKVMIANKG